MLRAEKEEKETKVEEEEEEEEGPSPLDSRRVDDDDGEYGNADEDEDDDGVPLVVAGGGAEGDDDACGRRRKRTSARGEPSAVAQCLRQRRVAAAALLVLAGGLAAAAGRFLLAPGTRGSGTGRSQPHPSSSSSVGPAARPGEAADPDRPVPALDGSPAVQALSSAQALRREFEAGRAAYLQRLESEYGAEHVASIFVQQNVTVGRLVLRSASGDMKAVVPDTSDMGPSWDRLKRRMMIKVLQARLAGTPASPSGAAREMPTFRWATGGHSAAAAHGDLYSESYSAALERAVRPVLERIGVWFEARNYAMGGTSSAPEVALCHVPIFGDRVDAVSWDFGMTDGHEVAGFEMYFRQASLSPSRPACIGLQMGNDPNRVRVLQHLEGSGVAALFMPQNVFSAVVAGIPDSASLDAASLPPFVRHFKCDGAVEQGEPGCAGNKWTDVVGPNCPNAKYRTSWHPGWKWHALMGNVLGLSILEVVDDAISELEKVDLSNGDAVGAFYQELKRQEDRDYDAFASSEPTEDHEGIIHEGWEDVNLLSHLYKTRPYCHTALLPAETRYLGILTESRQVGFFHYDVGTSRHEAEREANNGTDIRLAYDPDQRQACDQLLQVDYKDYFYVGEPEGAKSLTLPNDAELRAYGTGQPLLGVVGFALTLCDWGKCPAGNLLEPQLDTGEWEMSINGVPVTGRLTIESPAQAIFVRHKDGWYFPPNDDGRFEIQVRVTGVGMYVRLSSIFIF